MLTTKLINPEIMTALSKCGHGDKILIADANFPLDSNVIAVARDSLSVPLSCLNTIE